MEFLEFYSKCKEKGLLKNDYVFYCDVDLFVRPYMECHGYYYTEFGIVYDRNNKEIIPMENAPEFIDAYLQYQSMYQEGLIREFPTETNNPNPVNSLEAVLENTYPVYPALHRDLIRTGILGYSQFDARYVVHTLNADESFYMSYSIRLK